MKKYLFVIVALYFGSVNAQVLPVPVVIQEQDQWCWAGCTKCILNYYGDSVRQCDIAEYVRTVATWHSYGATPCCTDATLGCNYWNYNWGFTGSIQDILVHFDGITNHGTGALSLAEMDTEAVHYFPFVCHWSWVGGGGHFVVGNGVDASNNIHYMNPWFGEGAHICTYSWMLSDGSHNYDATNVLDYCPVTSHPGVITGASSVGIGATITLSDTASGGTWSCSNPRATVSSAGAVTGASAGWDTVMYTVSGACGPVSAKWPVHVGSSLYVNTAASAYAQELKVYPNPNKGSFTLSLLSDINEDVTIEITNMVGTRIMEFTTHTNVSAGVDIDQPSGVYFLSASTSHGKCVSKILLNR